MATARKNENGDVGGKNEKGERKKGENFIKKTIKKALKLLLCSREIKIKCLLKTKCRRAGSGCVL